MYLRCTPRLRGVALGRQNTACCWMYCCAVGLLPYIVFHYYCCTTVAARTAANPQRQQQTKQKVNQSAVMKTKKMFVRIIFLQQQYISQPTKRGVQRPGHDPSSCMLLYDVYVLYTYVFFFSTVPRQLFCCLSHIVFTVSSSKSVLSAYFPQRNNPN